MSRIFLSILTAAVVGMLVGRVVPITAQTTTNCSLPLGAFAASVDDPMVPAYCVSPEPAAQKQTAIVGPNDWVDNFGIAGVGRLNDNDMGYRVFDGQGGISLSKHLVVGDHWIDDNQLQYNGGAMLRPAKTFKFESGKLVVEGDAASGKQAYGGDQWVEITISMASAPDLFPPDEPEQGYAYGRFHGAPTFGCRFQNGGQNTCAGFLGNSTVNYPANNLPFAPTYDKAPCYSLPSDRLWELGFFQDCGNNFGGIHFGGFSDAAHSVWRSCPIGSDYDGCLDRFRIELTKTSFVLYVNGIRYFEDSGWDSLHSLPDRFVTGQVYVYYDDWGQGAATTTASSVRFHWGRLAVNPHNPDGTFMAPSASPSFGQPVATPVAVVPTQSPTAAPTATPTVASTPTPSPTAQATPIATIVATVVVPITCQVDVRINGVEGGWKPC